MSDTLTMVVGEKGRLVIPAAFRTELGLRPGDKLLGRIEAGNLLLEPPHELLARVRGRLQGPDSVVDELLAQRRAEAASEADDS